jgi:hypothetical protein
MGSCRAGEKAEENMAQTWHDETSCSVVWVHVLGMQPMHAKEKSRTMWKKTSVEWCDA